ncbi:alpha-amylase family glycosyl hydrolase, partial [Anaerosporobacter sp.]|uniref:alpha-amylase family glycosyl hydrolase n=1 Tax=Anaerosporobacter sp. TaxID=1872529 RepID=UPI00286EDB27
LDLVINHSSAEHPWFKASQDPESNYRSWYIWSTTDNTEGYDLKASAFDNPSWHKNSSGYYAGIFGETLPDFNYEEPAVREEMKQIAKFWLEKGVAGFRLDAAKHIYDASKTKNGTDSTEKAVEWWKEFSDYCKTINPDAFLLGEIWDTSELRYEYMSALDSSFVFDIGTDLFGQSIKDGKNTDNGIATTMKEEFDNVASKTPDAIDSLFLSNHDTTRINTTMENRRGQMKLTAALNLTMQGLPFVYYGEEIGMLGDTLGTDTNVRTPFLWGNEDSMTTSWFSDYSNDNTQDANAQSEDPYSLLSHYRKLIQLRAKSPALYKGVFEPIANGNEAISSYEMQSDEQTMLIIHNLSTEEQTAFLNTKGRIVFTTNEVKVWRTASSIVIPPLTTVIIER